MSKKFEDLELTEESEGAESRQPKAERTPIEEALGFFISALKIRLGFKG
jgi:hypothetical protein